MELGLKVIVFKGADTFEYVEPKMEGERTDSVEDKARQESETTRQRERELSGSLAMMAVGLPLYLYHWKTIQRENKN